MERMKVYLAAASFFAAIFFAALAVLLPPIGEIDPSVNGYDVSPSLTIKIFFSKFYRTFVM